MSKYTTKERMITHTGSHNKVIINLKVAEKHLDKELLKRLNQLLVDINHVQEMKQGKIPN